VVLKTDDAINIPVLAINLAISASKNVLARLGFSVEAEASVIIEDGSTYIELYGDVDTLLRASFTEEGELNTVTVYADMFRKIM